MGGSNSKRGKNKRRQYPNTIQQAEQRSYNNTNGEASYSATGNRSGPYLEGVVNIDLLNSGNQLMKNPWRSEYNVQNESYDNQFTPSNDAPSTVGCDRIFKEPHIRPNSVRSDYYNRNLERRIRRCNSLDQQFDPRQNQHYSPLYLEPQYRSHSLNNITGSGSHCEGRRGGVKRNSWDEDSHEDGSSSMSNGCFRQGQGLIQNFDDGNFVCQNVEPRVKRRLSENDGINYSVNGSEVSSCRNSDIYDDDQNDFTDDNADIQSFGQSYEPFDVLDILSFPSEWSSCAVNRTGYVEIPFSSPEGRSVMKFFQRTSGMKDFKLEISSVTRIESPFLHTMYLMKKEELAARNGHVDEVFLFHGTKKENLNSICENNLNWRMYSNSHRFGQGVSFSPIASYSSHYCDNNSAVKAMLLFKVLVSNASIGTENMEIPPDEEQVVFDASIKEDATVIVKYADNEYYPLYKIMFTKQPI